MATKKPKVKTTADGNPRLPAIPIAEGDALVRRPRGRPAVLTEPATKATVAIYERQILALDRLITDIRAASGTILDRSALIRAAVEGLIRTGIDPATVKNEADAVSALLAKLAGEKVR